MTNIVRTIFNSFILAVFGYSITIFLSYFALSNLALFWSLTIILWIIIGIINGFFLKSLKESFYSGLIISIFSFCILFILFIILGLFSDFLIDVFSIAILFARKPVILFSFVYALLATLIVVFITILFTIVTFFGKKYITQSSAPRDLDNIEEKFYQEYESNNTSGHYTSSNEDK